MYRKRSNSHLSTMRRRLTWAASTPTRCTTSFYISDLRYQQGHHHIGKLGRMKCDKSWMNEGMECTCKRSPSLQESVVHICILLSSCSDATGEYWSPVAVLSSVKTASSSECTTERVIDLDGRLPEIVNNHFPLPFYVYLCFLSIHLHFQSPNNGFTPLAMLVFE